MFKTKNLPFLLCLLLLLASHSLEAGKNTSSKPSGYSAQFPPSNKKNKIISNIKNQCLMIKHLTDLKIKSRKRKSERQTRKSRITLKSFVSHLDDCILCFKTAIKPEKELWLQDAFRGAINSLTQFKIAKEKELTCWKKEQENRWKSPVDQAFDVLGAAQTSPNRPHNRGSARKKLNL